MFILAGVLTGLIFARFKTPDFHHASLIITKGDPLKTLFAGDYDGRQALALSMKNLQKAKDIEIRVEGAEIQSWYPPVVKMPYYKWMGVEGGRFRGVDFGRRIPVYLVFDEKAAGREIEIFDLSDNSLIQKVQLTGEGSHAGNH
jgi:hypothetical protein